MPGFPLFVSLSENQALFIIFCVCFPNFRWKHRGHTVPVPWCVLGGVAGSSCGLCGVAIELCDLLQREGNQL